MKKIIFYISFTLAILAAVSIIFGPTIIKSLDPEFKQQIKKITKPIFTN